MTPDEVAEVLSAIAVFVEKYPPAAMFQLAREGYDSVFEVLIGCIISVRTLEEDTFAVSRRLFAQARTPAEVAALDDDTLLALLNGSTFPEPKVRQIKGIAERAIAEFGGDVPADYDTLISFSGVGPKCASLTLGVATKQTPHTPVDTHVHRVTNRWGLIETKTPEKSMIALDKVLTPQQRIDINRLLVPFGKYHCTGGTLPPRCSTCPVYAQCDRVGVAKHR